MAYQLSSIKSNKGGKKYSRLFSLKFRDLIIKSYLYFATMGSKNIGNAMYEVGALWLITNSDLVIFYGRN